MRRAIVRLPLLLLAVALAFIAWAQTELGATSPQPIQPETKRALVLWHANNPTANAEVHTIMVANLFGRFGQTDIRAIDDYRKGDGAAYDVIFVVPSRDRVIPEALLADVRVSPRPVVWLQYQIDALFADAGFASRQGWLPAPQRRATFSHVIYKGVDLPHDERVAVMITDAMIVDPSRAQVLATAVGHDGSATPWAVRSGNLLFVLENPFVYAHEDDRYLAFADLLYEVVAPDTPRRWRAMVRLEDIGPDADPARIRYMADLLAAEGVPFALAVYDTYRDPDGYFNSGKPLRFSLRQRPAIVRALEYARSRGGTLIAHGHTHQNDARRNPYVRVSGGDFEFFAADLKDGEFVHIGPLPGNSVELWRDRFEASRKAWRRADLPFPEIFTTPHYAGWLEAYRAAMQVYRARYERVLYFPGELSLGRPLYDRESKGQFFPYPVVDIRGDLILPENLGYSSSIEQGGYFGRPGEWVVGAAARNRVIRDGFASFFHHWYEDPATLRETVRGIKRLGYRFVSPADVLRDAPAHARATHTQPNPVALSVAAWIGDMPRLDAPVLAACGLLLLLLLQATGRRQRRASPRPA